MLTFILENFALLLLFMILIYVLFKLAAFVTKDHHPKFVSKIHSKCPLSGPEQVLFLRLKNTLPDMEILPQVAMSRFLQAKGGTAKKNFNKFRSFSQKSISFLVCDKSFSIMVAIELDNSSHTVAKDKIFKESGIKLVRWDVNSIPTEVEIKKLIMARIK